MNKENNATRENLRQKAALSMDDLGMIFGGNDDKPKNPKGKGEGTPYTCPFCGETIMIYQFEDGPKHVTQDCPKSPYK